MKIQIKLSRDSDNSFPEGYLQVENSYADSDDVFLTISDSVREICVPLQELLGALNLLKDTK